jgi:carbonic anhydrase
LVDLDSVLVQRCDGVCAEGGNADDQGTRSIDDAVERLGIREIILCGHASPAATDNGSETPRPQWASGVQGMLQRVRAREARNQQAREHLVRQLCELASRPVVARAIERGELIVHGLFYLAESGVFTRYDPLSGQFIPLGDLDAAA